VGRLFISLFSLTMLLGCAAVSQSASMAFDNANSAIRTGDEKLWQSPDKGNADEEKRKQNESDENYY
jgi:hypothetical protein